MLEALLGAVTEAVFSHVLAQTGIVERVRDWLGQDPAKLAFKAALTRSYCAFARAYPQWTASLFDESFLKTEAAPELALILTRARSPDAGALAERYVGHLGLHDPTRRAEYVAHLTPVAKDLLHWLEAELKEQPALQPLFDHRALAALPPMAEDVAAIRQVLEEARDQAARYHTVVEQAQGMAIGDHAQVTNTFITYMGGIYATQAELYIRPDPVFEPLRLDEFTGRAWLREQLDNWLANPATDRGTWLLEGVAGMGKTAFLAHLVRERGYLHHFVAKEAGKDKIVRALPSLCAQLIGRYQLEAYAKQGTLPWHFAGYPDFFEKLLWDAAKQLAAGERLVIVIDALDEAEVPSGQNALGLPRTLPKGVYFLVSQRTAAVPLHQEPHPTCVRFAAYKRDNLQDMLLYLREVTQRLVIAEQLQQQGYPAAKFVKKLLRKSAGVWTYLRYIINEIERKERALSDLDSLPLGLVSYYSEYWGRWQGRSGDWEHLYAPLLAALAAAKEPVTLEQLREWTGVSASPWTLQKLLGTDWGAFVIGTDNRYRLQHPSLRDFLSGAVNKSRLVPFERAIVDEMQDRTHGLHRDIADYYQQACAGHLPRLASIGEGYGLRHYAAHLAAAGRWPEAHVLVAEGGDGQSWAEARHGAEGSYAHYLADLGLVWGDADRAGQEDSSAVGRQVRYALIQSSIRALDADVPPELLAALVEYEHAGWTPTAALGYVRKMTEPWQQSQAIGMLAPLLASGELLSKAWEIVRSIALESARAAAIGYLAPFLAPQIPAGVVAEAYALPDVYARGLALSSLLPYLQSAQHQQVLAEAAAAYETLQGAEVRASVLKVLGRHIPDLLPPFLESIGTITRELARAEALSDMVPLLPPDLLPLALESARAMADPGSRGWALTALLRYLSPQSQAPVLEQALSDAFAAQDYARGRILCRLLEHLPPAQRAQARTEALNIAAAIYDESARAWMLGDLAAGLTGEQRDQGLGMARSIEDKAERARALCALARSASLTDRAALLVEALGTTRAIGDRAACDKTMAALATCRPAEQLPPGPQHAGLPRALAAACEREPEYLRAPALGDLVVRWAAWAQQDRTAAYASWPRVLHRLASRSRPAFLSDLRILAPIITVLGGAESLSAAGQAIQAVSCWWP